MKSAGQLSSPPWPWRMGGCEACGAVVGLGLRLGQVGHGRGGLHPRHHVLQRDVGPLGPKKTVDRDEFKRTADGEFGGIWIGS